MFPPLPQAIRAINGNENHETTAEDFTNSVFDRIDINGDGECGRRRATAGGWTGLLHLSAAALPVRNEEDKLEAPEEADEPTSKPEISHNMLTRPLNGNYADVPAQTRLESPFVSAGELSLEEFVEGARSDQVFMEVMIKSLDLAHIVAMIHNRRHSV